MIALPVDREVDRLPDANVVVRLGLAGLQRHLQLAERRRAALQDDEVAVVLERGSAVRGNGRTVDRAGAQGRDAGLLVGERLQRDRVHVREALLPEVLVGHQLDTVVRVEADHPVRAGTDRVTADVDLVVETGRNDRRVAAPREEAEDTRVARLQVEPSDVLGDDVDAEEGRHLADRRDAARQRRVQHHLDRVLHVTRVELLAVVELDALAQVEGDRLLVGRDLPRRGQRRLEVEVAVPLDERVVRGLLAPVVGGQDRPERRHVHRILLERPDQPAAVLRLRRGERLLLADGGLGRARHGTGSNSTGRNDARLDERVAASDPAAHCTIGSFFVGHSTSLLSWETVRGSDRPWEPHPGCRHKRRTRGPECLRACSPPRDRPRPRAPARRRPR